MTDIIGGLPNLLIPGFPKCGTTSVAETLSGHPDVSTAKPHRATHFFTPRFYDRSVPLAPVSEYAEHFARSGDARIRLDDTAIWAYGGSPLVADIKATLVDPKILIMMREPSSRTASYLTWKKRNAQIDQGIGLAAYVQKCEALGPRSVKVESLNEWSGLFGSEYDRYLPAWIEEFGDDLRIGFMEDLRDKPIDFYQALSSWLGIEKSYFSNETVKIANTAKSVRSPRLEKRIRTIGRLAQPLARNFPGLYARLRDAARDANTREVSPGRPDPTVDELISRFAPMIERCRTMVTGHTLLGPPEWLIQIQTDGVALPGPSCDQTPDRTAC